MRFEVNVDDGNNLDTLHKAREAYNAAHPEAAAADMPSFVQHLMDQAVAGSIEPLGPTTLSAAMTRIAELEAENAELAKDVKLSASTQSAAPSASA